MSVTHRSDNVGAWTSLRARRDPDREAVVCGDRRVTYAELDAAARRVAGALRESGVEPGDRVAVALKNRVEFLELLFGVARAGAIFVPLNFRLASEEVAYALGDSGSRLVVVQADTAAAVAAALERLEGAGIRVLSVDEGGPDRGSIPSEGYAAWRDAAAPAEPHPVAPADPVSIVYTSGTTGLPKGAVLTHEGVLVNVMNYLADWDLRRDDATLVVNPIFHVVLYILAVPLLYKGGKVVLMEDFEPAAAARLAERERITVWFAIPTAWQMMLASEEFAAIDLSRLRFVGSGGAACPQPLMDRFAELGLDYRQGYGLTETTSSATTMGPGDQAERPGSIGRPFFHVEARIVDEEGAALAPGGVGEIQLRGRNLCAGYWRKPEETAAAFDADGWFSHRRRRPRRRGGLHLDRRPQEGPDHLRRREHLLDRGRAGGGDAPAGGGGCGDRPPRRALGRDPVRGRHLGRRRRGRGGGPDRPLPRADRPLQVPDGGGDRRRAAEDGQRQDRQAGAARAGRRALSGSAPETYPVPSALQSSLRPWWYGSEDGGRRPRDRLAGGDEVGLEVGGPVSGAATGISSSGSWTLPWRSIAGAAGERDAGPDLGPHPGQDRVLLAARARSAAGRDLKLKL